MARESQASFVSSFGAREGRLIRPPQRGWVLDPIHMVTDQKVDLRKALVVGNLPCTSNTHPLKAEPLGCLLHTLDNSLLDRLEPFGESHKNYRSSERLSFGSPFVMTQI